MLFTTNALISIVENIQTNLDNGECTGGFLTDLRKACDTAAQKPFLQKHEHYGIREQRNTEIRPGQRNTSLKILHKISTETR